MELDDSLSDRLCGIVLSWLCAHGEPLDELFKKDPELKKIFETVNNHTVSETTMKSRKEAVARRLRGKTHKNTHNRKIGSNIDPLGMITPKKTPTTGQARGNDPRRRHAPRTGVSECAEFIAQHVNIFGDKLATALAEFADKTQLLNMVEKFLAVRGAGWKLQEGKLVNKTGQTLVSEWWDLLPSGRVAPKGGLPLTYNAEWLLAARDSLLELTNGQKDQSTR